MEKLNKGILIKYLEASSKKCVASVMNEMCKHISKTLVLMNYYEIGVMCNLYDYCVIKNKMNFEEFKEKFLGDE